MREFLIFDAAFSSKVYMAWHVTVFSQTTQHWLLHVRMDGYRPLRVSVDGWLAQCYSTESNHVWAALTWFFFPIDGFVSLGVPLLLYI